MGFRLLYVIDSLSPGGAEISLAEMAPELVRLGVNLHVLPLRDRMELRPRLEASGAVVHHAADRTSRVGAISRVSQTIRHVRPDLVHTTLYEANVSARIAARLHRVPSSTSIVGDTYGRWSPAGVLRLKLSAARLVDQATARGASRFHVVSQHLALAAATHLRVPMERIDVIPRGRDRRRFPLRTPEVRDDVRAELGVRADTPMVLAVGRLERVKGLNYLMEALPQLSLMIPGVQIVVAGKDGATGTELRAAAGRSKVPVVFLGHRTDVGRLLSAADVLAFPSLSEGSPGTLIEAMATGCPIVASSIPPNTEVLGTGVGSTECGLTVPSGDAAALAHALAAVLERDVDVEGMVSRARRRFEAHYENGAVTARMVEFFQKAASAS